MIEESVIFKFFISSYISVQQYHSITQAILEEFFMSDDEWKAFLNCFKRTRWVIYTKMNDVLTGNARVLLTEGKLESLQSE